MHPVIDDAQLPLGGKAFDTRSSAKGEGWLESWGPVGKVATHGHHQAGR
jgi:hypothetical protein